MIRLKNFGADELVATYDFDPIVCEEIGEEFNYRLEVFKRRTDSKFYVKLWRMDRIRVQISFPSQENVMPEGVDVVVNVQEQDYRWDNVCEDSIGSALDKVTLILRSDFINNKK